jgi:hypothetical protein
LIGQRSETNGTVPSFYIKVIFERDGQAMQWSNGLAGSFKVFIERLRLLYCFVEECIA